MLVPRIWVLQGKHPRYRTSSRWLAFKFLQDSAPCCKIPIQILHSGKYCPSDTFASLSCVNCNYVPFHGKKHLADEIKALETENHPEFLCWAQCNHKSPHETVIGGSASEKGMWQWKEKVDDAGKEPWAQDCRQTLWAVEKAREEFSLWSLWRDTSLLTPWV